MNKIRVSNPHKFSIGVSFFNGTERAILPGSFTLMTREEIEYLASFAPGLFEGEKLLRLEDRELAAELGFIDSVDDPMFDEDEIRKHLNQRAQQMKAWLDGVEEPYLLDEICDVAMKMDLPASKLQILQERMPERKFWNMPESESLSIN